MEFSKKLRELRLQKGISQAKLAAEIHISRSAVAKWENGLGLPNEESLKDLAVYFDVPIAELIADKESEQLLVSKNRTIEDQNQLIIGLAAGAGIGLFLLGYFFIEPLRDSLTSIALGFILIILGAFNIKGNIATIHWYNRRKVSKEDQMPYCRLVGFGSIMIGASIIASAIIQVAVANELGVIAGGVVTLAGVIGGLVMILAAQIKYNKGLF